jgi:hypothetical protein
MSSFKKTINDWNKTKDKPLMIYGVEGCGKTTLARSLLIDYNIIYVAPENIENINIEEFIHASVSRKDILQLLSKSPGKAFLIDDFHLFKVPMQSKLVDIFRTCKIPLIIVSSRTSRTTEKLLNFSYLIELRYTNKEILNIIRKNVITDMKDAELLRFVDNCQSNLNIIFLHIHVKQNNTDRKGKTEQLTEELMNNKFSHDYFEIAEYNTVGFNFLTDIYKYIDKECIHEVYESIICGGIIESGLLNDSIHYDLLIIYNVICPHKIITDNRNSVKYLYKYNNYLSKSMICVHQHNILSELTRYFGPNIDDILINFIQNTESTLDISNNPLLIAFIFKRINYLGTILKVKNSKKSLTKRMIS